MCELNTCLTLIPYEFSYLLAASFHSFRQGEGVAHKLHNVIDFLKKKKKNLVPHSRRHVLGLDYSGYPATNTSSELALSALKRVKSYLHTTMSNNRLSHLMVCVVYMELAKELNI